MNKSERIKALKAELKELEKTVIRGDFLKSQLDPHMFTVDGFSNDLIEYDPEGRFFRIRTPNVNSEWSLDTIRFMETVLSNRFINIVWGKTEVVGSWRGVWLYFEVRDGFYTHIS